MAGSNNELTRRLRAPFQNLVGGFATRFTQMGWMNDWVMRAGTAGRYREIDLIGSDSLDNRLLAGQVSKGITTPIKLMLQANAKCVTTPIFVNAGDTANPLGTPMEVTRIDCIFGTAGTDAAAVTGYVTKDVAGQAPGTGTTVMTGTFNLKATANTIQTANHWTPTGTLCLAGPRGIPSTVLAAGEQLTFVVSGVNTALANLAVTVWLRPHTGASIATAAYHANGDIATSTMYLNVIPGQVIRAVSMRWGTAGTNGSAVTADITKDVSTNAPGAGTSILTAAQSVKGTANTPVYPALAASTATLTMALGDRLALKMTGTLTALADLVVTVFFQASGEQHFVVPVSFWDAAASDRTAFIANEYFQVVDYWETWSTAGTSGTHLLTKDTGTTAPGAGTGLLSDNTNTGIISSGTANTPVGSLVVSAVSLKENLYLAPGDRLGIKNAGTAGAVAGIYGAIILRKL